MDLDARVGQLLRDQRSDQACDLVLRELGPGLRGYLDVVVRHPADAEEAWARATVDVWRALPTFRGQSALKTYVYRIGWHAALKVLRDPYRRRRRSWSQAGELETRGRSQTAAYLRSDVRIEVQAARTLLTPVEQALLTLRIDRGMSWEEVAASLGTRAPAARKRFERVKAKLRGVVRGRVG